MFCDFHKYGRITAPPENRGEQLVFSIMPTFG